MDHVLDEALAVAEEVLEERRCTHDEPRPGLPACPPGTDPHSRGHSRSSGPRVETSGAALRRARQRGYKRGSYKLRRVRVGRPGIDKGRIAAVRAKHLSREAALVEMSLKAARANGWGPAEGPGGRTGSRSHLRRMRQWYGPSGPRAVKRYLRRRPRSSRRTVGLGIDKSRVASIRAKHLQRESGFEEINIGQWNKWYARQPSGRAKGYRAPRQRFTRVPARVPNARLLRLQREQVRRYNELVRKRATRLRRAFKGRTW